LRGIRPRRTSFGRQALMPSDSAWNSASSGGNAPCSRGGKRDSSATRAFKVTLEGSGARVESGHERATGHARLRHRRPKHAWWSCSTGAHQKEAPKLIIDGFDRFPAVVSAQAQADQDAAELVRTKGAPAPWTRGENLSGLRALNKIDPRRINACMTLDVRSATPCCQRRGSMPVVGSTTTRSS